MIKCPICEKEFGYLHLDNLHKIKGHIEFMCPKCGSRLNNAPLQDVNKRINFYIYGGAILIACSVAYSYFIEGKIFGIPVLSIAMIIGVVFLSLGYREIVKFDAVKYYKEVGRRDAP